VSFSKQKMDYFEKNEKIIKDRRKFAKKKNEKKKSIARLKKVVS